MSHNRFFINFPLSLFRKDHLSESQSLLAGTETVVGCLRAGPDAAPDDSTETKSAHVPNGGTDAGPVFTAFA